MKVKIIQDERFPDYDYTEVEGGIEIPDKIISRWNKTLFLYNKMQDEMEVYFNYERGEK
jgi:hypothetical protein